jgi:predicted Zn-ribbon and HTH transcriptional regulator
MRIIKHGSTYEIETLTCKKCGCVFAYNRQDVKIKEEQFDDMFGKETYEISVVYCPECKNMIEVKGFI